MTKVILLEALKVFTEEVTAQLLLPVQLQEEDEEIPPDRPATVYIPRLPELRSYAQKAPFITHEVVTSKDKVESNQRGLRIQTSQAVVRTCFCVYQENEQEGGLALLNLMEQLRISLLEQEKIGAQFMLDMDAGVEMLVYPVNPGQTAASPFYLGEMITTWRMPPVKRLDVARVTHGMPPFDPQAQYREETIQRKGNERNGKEDD